MGTAARKGVSDSGVYTPAPGEETLRFAQSLDKEDAPPEEYG